MLQERSQNAEPKLESTRRKKITRRRFTEKKRRKIVYFANLHGIGAAMEKFNMARSVIRRWQIVAGEKPKPRTTREPRVGQNLHLLARKLKEAVRKRLMEGVELEEVEIYASLLVKEILK